MKEENNQDEHSECQNENDKTDGYHISTVETIQRIITFYTLQPPQLPGLINNTVKNYCIKVNFNQ